MVRLFISGLVLLAPEAFAHIKLIEPADWLQTSSAGDPQKEGPCGSSSGTPTGVITTVMAGSKLHLRWQETVFHPGHFRVAIAANRSAFTDPVVTTGSGQCISAATQATPVAPVMADGLFVHTSSPGSTPYETDITVPNTPCEHCTLQLIQFMSSHPAPCIYYHCADLRIVAASDGGFADGGSGVPRSDGGTGAGSQAPQPANSGCQHVPGSLAAAVLLAMVLLRRPSGSGE